MANEFSFESQMNQKVATILDIAHEMTGLVGDNEVVHRFNRAVSELTDLSPSWKERLNRNPNWIEDKSHRAPYDL